MLANLSNAVHEQEREVFSSITISLANFSAESKVLGVCNWMNCKPENERKWERDRERRWHWEKDEQTLSIGGVGDDGCKKVANGFKCLSNEQ